MQQLAVSEARALAAPPLPPTPAKAIAWRGLAGSADALAIALASQHAHAPLLVATADARQASLLAGEIRFYLGDDDATSVYEFPDWECLAYDRFSPHPDIVSRRLLTLYRIPALTRGVICVPVANLMQRMPPIDYVLAHSFVLAEGDRLDLDGLSERLARSAYQRVSQVMQPGEFSVRGGLIDIYPSGADRPYRVDLFDDEVDSIRHFDVDTQRSTEKVDSVRLLPAREFPMTEAGIRQFRQNFRSRFEGDPQAASLYRDVSQGLAPAGIEFYLPLFFETTATLFDFLPDNVTLILADGVSEAALQFEHEVRERFDAVAVDRERPPLHPNELFLPLAELHQRLDAHCRVQIAATGDNASQARQRDLPALAPLSLPVHPHGDNPYAALVGHLQSSPGRTLLVAETAGRRELLEDALTGHGLRPVRYANWPAFLTGDADIGIAIAPLERGLRLDEPAISAITETQLFGERVIQRRRRGRPSQDPEAIIRSLAELRLGDPVVHEAHGVGRYRGLQVLQIDGHAAEFLTLEYHGGNRLYVPVLSLGVISRYLGAADDAAPWHKLGNDAWSRARRRARERAHDVAAELLEIQALRAARKGFTFPAPDEGYAAFIARFPFEETPDQLKVEDEVIADMASAHPMDRLVCGDVGFGKTEIAMRAAFLAVNGSRQVAVLVPTTLLAQQHFQNFRDRFADLPLRVEVLSRFRSTSEVSAVLADTAAGKVDILIGTHRLLQRDVRFRRLGLAIIDEEHRFGVRQKERLKALRSEVDILTLTATPIPRTLNLCMAGLRDISIIGTPPRDRLSVKTFVREWSDPLVREACLREIRRGGQVYFLHNEVRTIERISAQIEALVPECRIRVAHGQMPERELEDIMREFYHQRFNILVCTTIIESGIDVPSANTIIINRADRFGLAQLHQLRGRVGRSHHQAYAYLITPPRKAITADAIKRLDAIESLEDLGAGFTLASHDLEIRGAGDLLGEAQSGTIDEVGFTLYAELLNEAIRSLATDSAIVDSIGEPPARQVEMDLHVPALLPDDYLPDVHARLVMYKRLSAATDRNTLDELRVETVDRFGALPPPAVTLFRIAELRLAAAACDIARIDVGAQGGVISFRDGAAIDPAVVVALIQRDPQRYRLSEGNAIRISTGATRLDDLDARIACVTEFLDSLRGDSSPQPRS